MGVVDFFRTKFSKGGIKVALTVPKDFRWDDESIPVTVTLTGHKTESSTVMPMIFVVEDVVESSGSNEDGPSYGSRVRISWQRDGDINLAPGEDITLQVPIRIASAVEDHAGAQASHKETIKDTSVGRFIGAASKLGLSLGSMTDPRDIRDYRISVQARAMGVQNPAKASKKIRQGGAFHMNKPTLGW